jgi:hypothetical protein
MSPHLSGFFFFIEEGNPAFASPVRLKPRVRNRFLLRRLYKRAPTMLQSGPKQQPLPFQLFYYF